MTTRSATRFAYKDVFADNEGVEVAEGLYLGALGAALNARWLKQASITHILSMIGDWRTNPNPDPDTLLQRMFVDIDDTPSAAAQMAAEFDRTYLWLEHAIHRGAKQRALVHCHMGISRSVSIVCYYLMRRYGLGLEMAMDQIRQVRPIALPNSGFLNQLRKADRHLAFLRLRDATAACVHSLWGEKSFPVITALIVDYALEAPVTQRICYGDQFECLTYALPPGLCITSEFSEDHVQLPPDDMWKPTTVHIDRRTGSWCLLTLWNRAKVWLLLHEASRYPHTTTLYTVPQLLNKTPEEDDDGLTVLPSNNPHFLILDELSEI